MRGDGLRRWGLVLLLGAGCRIGSDAERAAEVQGLCEDYCARRVECVADGWAKGDALLCTQMCASEERYALANECGEASYAALECMSALTCEELPAAVAGLAGDGTAACHEEQAAQREACTFLIVR